jgi:NAD(P)-dependent dehydrogenase (short-subunit alcohol dehydrogenase family)
MSDRISLVVGGTKGIGRAVTARLLEHGPVVAAYRADEVAADALRRALGTGALTTTRSDVSTRAGVDALVDEVLERHGRLDTIVFAAVEARLRSPLTLDEDDWHAVLAATTTPLLWLGQRMAALAPEQGRLIALTSPWSRRYVEGYGAIGPAKAALESLVVHLAAELAALGTTVNAVSAGLVDTELMRSQVPASHVDALARRTPVGRIGRPEDVADMVAFVAGPGTDWVTGQVLTLDGGYFLR